MSGKNTHTGPGNGKDGRLRLLNAAEELFADKGLDATSIRDLTTKAHCNLALVNYHFGDKKQLYEELFRERLRKMRDSRLAAIKKVMADKNKRSLEKLLGSFAKAFLEPFTDRQASRRFMKLFAREMCEQHLPKGVFIEETAGPTLIAMCKALGTLCPHLDESDARQCVLSVIAQLVQVIQFRGMFEGDNLQLAAFDAPATIEHIVRFSVAGIRAYEADKDNAKT